MKILPLTGGWGFKAWRALKQAFNYVWGGLKGKGVLNQIGGTYTIKELESKPRYCIEKTLYNRQLLTPKPW